MSSLYKELYTTKVLPGLMKEFGYRNALAAPRVLDVVLNVGIGRNRGDEKFVSTVQKTLERISGQKPIFTRAKKSIAAFKIREGQVIGAKVTLRGRRMEDFLIKLLQTAFARIHDFRGVSPKVVDAQGNCTVGFREHLAFPEIKPDEVERVHGLEVCIHTSAHTKQEGFALLKLMGLPFREEGK